MGFKVINEGEPITWIDFEKQIQIDIAEYKLQKKNKKKTGYHSPWIFRGQANAEWKLETSLERFLRDELGHTDNYYNAQKYYTYLSSIVPAINSLTEKCFERFTPHEIKFKKIGTVPQYELLCFARHHGFPTPILDWSHSYYVAAFFAFAQAKADQDVALFAYKEWSGEARGGWVADPIWDMQGPYVETHARHYKQQSVYTVCKAEVDDKVVFMQHEEATKCNPEDHNIKKFVLKASEKSKVLDMLYSMNINDYTLFDDYESLMRMLAYKEFVISDY